MADNYQLFSEMISGLTADEAEWIERMLGCDPEEPSILEEAGFDLKEIDLEYWPGFESELRNAEGEFWLYGDEYANVSHAGEFVRAFLAKFRSDQCWSLTWAETCSKPRVGEFGGGGLFVTAKEVTALNATDWVNQQRQQFD